MPKFFALFRTIDAEFNIIGQIFQIIRFEQYSTIVGPVPHDEVAAFYSLIDVFVVSRPNSRVTQLVTPLKPFEGQPMVALEAIASGTPVLLSDTIHSLPAEIPKAKYGDLDDWQNHLERILSSSLPTYQDTLLKPYSLDTVQQSWKRLYESLLV